MRIELSRLDNDFNFEATGENGNKILMDASPKIGGHDKGVSPMQTLLMGLAGCSAIDVISILKKQRQDVLDYKMTVSGEREKGKEPSLWQSINVEFHLYGDIDPDKASRAVDLSVNKYCSVAATLMGAGAEIKTQTFIHPAK